MKSASVIGWAALALLVVCWGQEARAELPPWAYPNPQDASEEVDIEVLSASKWFRFFASSFNTFRYKVEVVGKVMTVHRTATGLSPGSKITIRYDAHTDNRPGWCGPGSFPILAKGAVYKAHLTAVGDRNGVYTPCGAPYNAFQYKNEK